MNWQDAKSIIEATIVKGTDLRTEASSSREVVSINHQCRRYGYGGEKGFEVKIGKSNTIQIPISMLESCFYSLSEPEGYNGEVFRNKYQRQAKHHPCHVHTVGMIFMVAGIATTDGKSYYLKRAI